MAIVVAACGGSSTGFGSVPAAGDATASAAPDSGVLGDSGGKGVDARKPVDAKTDSRHDSASGRDAAKEAAGEDASADGGGLPPSPEAGADAQADSGGDAPALCFPVGIRCEGNTVYNCTDGVLTTTACTTPDTCADGYGCVVCAPGTGTCSGNVGSACNDTGTGYVAHGCDAELGETCDPTPGTCTGDCEFLGESYVGCEYYAVTMLNHLIDQELFYFAVSISNTGAQTANVTITGGALTTPTLASIPAGQLQVITLPWVPMLSCGSTSTTACCGAGNGCDPAAPGTEIVSGGAYHIKSTEPVTAYEFNAYQYEISNQYSFTNDASLLIPVNSMTGNYRVASSPAWGGFPGTIAVIGTVSGTSVTVTAPAGTLQSSGAIGSSGGTVTLNVGDVLQLESIASSSSTTYGAALSGTLITATEPVEVFGGHSCTNIPAAITACDHIEQISLPVETLRGDYLVGPPYNKNDTPLQTVKLIGVTNGTHLSFDPSSVSAPLVLNAGTVITLPSLATPFHVISTDAPELPFLVAQYMQGGTEFGGISDSGDPSESVAVATAQFRTEYQFVAPTSYTENWLSVIAPAGATVTVDGVAVTGFTAIGTASGYDVAHASLSTANNGVHVATSSLPFGIQVYGYGTYTS